MKIVIGKTTVARPITTDEALVSVWSECMSIVDAEARPHFPPIHLDECAGLEDVCYSPLGDIGLEARLFVALFLSTPMSVWTIEPYASLSGCLRNSAFYATAHQLQDYPYLDPGGLRRALMHAILRATGAIAHSPLSAARNASLPIVPILEEEQEYALILAHAAYSLGACPFILNTLHKAQVFAEVVDEDIADQPPMSAYGYAWSRGPAIQDKRLYFPDHNAHFPTIAARYAALPYIVRYSDTLISTAARGLELAEVIAEISPLHQRTSTIEKPLDYWKLRSSLAGLLGDASSKNESEMAHFHSPSGLTVLLIDRMLDLASSLREKSLECTVAASILCQDAYALLNPGLETKLLATARLEGYSVGRLFATSYALQSNLPALPRRLVRGAFRSHMTPVLQAVARFATGAARAFDEAGESARSRSARNLALQAEARLLFRGGSPIAGGLTALLVACLDVRWFLGMLCFLLPTMLGVINQIHIWVTLGWPRLGLTHLHRAGDVYVRGANALLGHQSPDVLWIAATLGSVAQWVLIGVFVSVIHARLEAK